MIIAAVLPLAPTHGAPVVVSNHNFEFGQLPDGGVQNNTNGFVWDYNSQSTAGTLRGFYNPTAGHYASAGGAGTPSGADEDQVGFLFKTGATAFQTLSGADAILGNADDPVLTAGTQYTLTLAVGNRLAGNPSGNFPFGTLAITLLAGSTVIAEDATSTGPAPGQFVDRSISVDSSTLSSALYGQPLSLRFRQMAVADSVADIDNVRLYATAVPEPSSVMLWSAGALVLGMCRRRRMGQTAYQALQQTNFIVTNCAPSSTLRANEVRC